MKGGILAVIAFALWHLRDVKAGVIESGESWLVGVYFLLLAVSVLILIGIFWKMLHPGKWCPAKQFLLCILTLGTLYAVVMPPLSAPDEVAHYISAYQLSNRILHTPVTDERGYVYVRAEDLWAEGRTDNEEGESNAIGQTLSQETYQAIREALRMPREKLAQSAFAVSCQPPVRTTPLVYLPQALGISLARILGLGTVGLLFLGRLFNLLFFAAIMALAIRRAPFGKGVFFGVGLLPMSIELAASMSYDVALIALSAYFGAICLDLAFCREKARPADIVLLAAILGIMGPCKMVYGVIAGFCLLIPVKKFGGWKYWFLGAACVLGAFALAMILVNLQTVAIYTGESERQVEWAGEAGYSFAQLLHSPLLVLKMCYNTVAWNGGKLFTGIFGGELGNLDAVLNTPIFVILGLSVALVLLAAKKPQEEIFFTIGARVWIWFLGIVCLGALLFSMLLAWTPISATTIQGVQGRYLLPLLPMLLLTTRNSRLVRTDGEDAGILFAMVCMDVYVILRVFAIVCLRVG